MPSDETRPLTAVGAGKVRVRIATNFIHDTCTGLWVASLVVIYSLASQLPGMAAEAASALSLAQVRLWWLLVLSLIGLAATGALRLSYWREQASPEELKAKRTALVVKHIAFLVIYGVGSVWAYSLVFPVV